MENYSNNLDEQFSCDIFNKLNIKINNLLQNQSQIIIAIDGNSGAGKSSLSLALQNIYDATIIQMDDFFLQPYQRTIERFDLSDGNIDFERFNEDVISKLKNGSKVLFYSKFDCAQGILTTPKKVLLNNIIIIEGTYSLHTLFRNVYDIKIFMSTTPETQLRRIEKSCGVKAIPQFVSRWIPLENRYFQTLDILELCDFIFET